MTDIFNANKNNYETPSLFLDEQGLGLFDTVNKKFPKIWERYKSVKSLDWDENEFDFESCANDFRTCDKSTYNMMIKSLAFQWEADSLASRLSTLLGCVVTSSELWAAWQRISDQEVIHAATYSEIVRCSFEDPRVVLDEILKIEQSLSRLNTVYKVMSEAHEAAHLYAAGLHENNQELYNKIFLFVIALYALERVQFISSFAVTFALCDTGNFQPIGKAVQKIAQDEFEEHVELDKEVLVNELKTPRGQEAFESNKDLIKSMLDEVVASEKEWNNYLFQDGDEVIGLNESVLNQWVFYNAKTVYEFLGIEPEEKLPNKNPLKFMESWLNISKFQSSPQEENNNQYKTGVMIRDDDNITFDDDL